MLRTVTSQNEKFILGRELVGGHVGIGGYDLVLGHEAVIFLKFEIAQCSR